MRLCLGQVSGPKRHQLFTRLTLDSLGLTLRTISLSLGREPTFPPRFGRDPSTLTDFDDDDQPWTPYYVNPVNRPAELANYVWQPKACIETFRHYCNLHLIIHDMIVALYSAESRLSPSQRIAFFARTRNRLEVWWSDFPADMKFEDPEGACPPPWIYLVQ